MEAQKKDPFEAGRWRDLEKLYRRGNIPAEFKRIRRVLKDNFDCGFLKGHNNTLASRLACWNCLMNVGGVNKGIERPFQKEVTTKKGIQG